MAIFKLEAADALGLETNMEINIGPIAGKSRNATVMEAQRSTLDATCIDHTLVGGTLVGRRSCLQTQRGNLRLEQLGKLGIWDLHFEIHRI